MMDTGRLGRTPLNHRESVALLRIHLLAKQIKNNLHFEHVLREAAPELREAVYKQLRPFLMFKSSSFKIFEKRIKRKGGK